MKQLLLLSLLLPLSLLSQTIEVTGTVTGADEMPLIGASVYSLVDLQGTVTDFTGNFSLQVTPGTELTFSYIGFSSEHHFIEDATTKPLNVKMTDGIDLPLVVVVGYNSCIKRCWNSCPVICYKYCTKHDAEVPNIPLSTLQSATVFPNPFVSHLLVDITPVAQTQLSAVLLDIAGREIKRWPTQELSPGPHSLTYRMGTARLLPGLYLLRLTDQDGRTEVRKVRKAEGS